MNRYPEYKDSGIEWIGEIPRSWAVGRLKWQIVANDGGIWGDSPQNDDSGTIVIRSTEITISGSWDMSNPMLRLLSSEERNKFQLKEGDIVITKSSGSPKHIGKSAVVNRDIEEQICSFSNFVQRIRFKSFLPSLYHYLLNSYLVREQYRFLTKSTTGLGNLDSCSIGEILLPYIPLQHQSLILHYLDQKTTQIDSLIEKLENKIELLKEYRVALISQSVTKGLDPDVEMKDSRIEWIGEIPKDWEIRRLKHLCSHIAEKRLPSEMDVRISPENVEAHSGKVLSLYSDYDSEGQAFREGDILFNKLRVYLNKVVLSKWTGLSMGEMIVLRPHSIRNNFLYRVMNSQLFIDYVNSLSEGVKMPRPPVEGILNSFVPLPHEVDQFEISRYIYKRTTQIDSLIEKLDKKVKLLKEYRQSLISNVVTGKIRISKQAA